MTSTRAPEARIAFGGKRTAESEDWIFGTGLRVIYRHHRCQFGRGCSSDAKSEFDVNPVDLLAALGSAGPRRLVRPTSYLIRLWKHAALPQYRTFRGRYAGGHVFEQPVSDAIDGHDYEFVRGRQHLTPIEIVEP